MKKLYCLSIIFLMFCSLFLISCTTTPNEPEYDTVTYCAHKLKNLMKDPESFEVYGSCGYYFNSDDLKDDVVYVVIPYRAKNGYGAYVTDTALFANNIFVGEISQYYSKSYTDWSKDDKITFLKASTVYLGGVYSKKYTKEEVSKGLR